MPNRTIPAKKKNYMHVSNFLLVDCGDSFDRLERRFGISRIFVTEISVFSFSLIQFPSN